MFVQSEQRWVGTRPGGARGEPGKVGLVYMLGVSLWMGLGSVSLWMGWRWGWICGLELGNGGWA